jgi:hypothetical protein
MTAAKTPNVVGLAPKLHDAVWRKLAGRHKMLCAECMFTRAAARDVRLSLASLQPCEFNLMCSPVSWFELFASVEIRPPKNLDAWRAVLRSTRRKIVGHGGDLSDDDA